MVAILLSIALLGLVWDSSSPTGPPAKQVKRAPEELIERGEVRFEGNNRWRRYWAAA
jgi:hypothetical protein